MLKRARQAADEIPPAGVSEVLAPHPLEISGVAAVPGGYAVVGDEDNEHGRICRAVPGSTSPANSRGPN